MAKTISPNVRAIPGCVTTPPLTWLITIAPVPAKTRKKVPNASAKYFLNSGFIAQAGPARMMAARHRSNRKEFYWFQPPGQGPNPLSGLEEKARGVVKLL